MPETGDFKPKRVAIYGGSFNPPHICHQLTVFYILQSCEIDQVWLTPCYRHAFAKSLAPFELRRHWCELLAEPFGAGCRVDDIERRLGGESRSIDTMEALQHDYPETEFSLILGSDIRGEVTRWKRFDDLQARFPILWIGRVGHFVHPDDRLVLPDVSSTRVREALQAGQPVQDWLPKNLFAELQQISWKW